MLTGLSDGVAEGMTDGVAEGTIDGISVRMVPTTVASPTGAVEGSVVACNLRISSWP